MRFSTLATALTSATLASSRLIGIAAPSILAINGTFPLTLISEGYIQSVDDIAVAYGFPVATGYQGALGEYTGSAYLGPKKSNQSQKNVTIHATVPGDIVNSPEFQGQKFLLSAAIYSLYGTSGSSSVTGYNVSVTLGNCTGGPIVETTTVAWKQTMLDK